jgi:hypothetical protein
LSKIFNFGEKLLQIMIQKFNSIFALAILLGGNMVFAQQYNYPKFQNDDDAINLSIIGYNDPKYITQNKKLELGVILPESVQQRVFNFVNKISGKEMINPYLEWELKVTAYFKNESSDEVIAIDGFYTQEYSTWEANGIPVKNKTDFISNEEYKNLGGYNLESNAFPFRIRFSPPKTGKWTCVVKIVTPKLQAQSKIIDFEVVPGGKEPIKIDKDGRFFERNNQPYYPIGCNITWPSTTISTDPELYSYFDYTINGVKYIQDEGYRPNYVVPRVYKKYQERLNLLADNGVNYMRLIMAPISCEIEWEELGNYTQRLHMAQEMDKLFEWAESRDVIMHLSTQLQMTFQKFGPQSYYSKWVWDDQINEQHFCYYNLLKGMPSQNFLINEDAKKYYKQRLRYIVARWGYSSSLGVYEFIAEANQIGNNESTDASGAHTYSIDAKPFEKWHYEMGEFMNNQYNGKNHIITTTYAGHKAKNDYTFASPNLTMMCSNLYDFGSPNFFSHLASISYKVLNDELLGESYTSIDQKMNAYHKPFMLTEFDALDSQCDKDKIDVIRAQWQSIFSGINGSLSWIMWHMPETFHHFEKMNSWTTTHLNLGANWHPGASERLADGSWGYRKNYYKSMDGWFTPKNSVIQRYRKADISYLRSGDKKSAFGVISNKTFNILSASNCCDSLFKFTNDQGKEIKEGDLGGLWYLPPSLRKAQSVSTNTEKLKLEGMEAGVYDIFYYKLNDLKKPFLQTKENARNGVALDVTLEASINEYLILFYAVKRK